MLQFLYDIHDEIKLNIHGDPEVTRGEHKAPVIDREEYHDWKKVAE